MLVGPGGRERTLEQYGKLFDAAGGYRLVGTTSTPVGLYVLEGDPSPEG